MGEGETNQKKKKNIDFSSIEFELLFCLFVLNLFVSQSSIFERRRICTVRAARSW